MEFYRYEMHETSAGIDQFGDPLPKLVPNPRVMLNTYNLHKETPKGYWIGHGLHCPDNLRGNSRWVSKTGKKRFAYPTKEEALHNFILRKERQLKILKFQTWGIEIALKNAKLMNERYDKYITGTKVLLPFKEEGEIIQYNERLWGSNCLVGITKSNGFNDVGSKVEFLLKDIIIS